jgi:sulfide:quinone oxidoreductase
MEVHMAQRIVIVGAGIGGVPLAYAIKSRLGGDVSVTLISASPQFEFTPSNPWVALGWRDAHDIAFPIAPYLNARDVVFIPTAVGRFEPHKNRVALIDGRTVDYDILIIATGPEPGLDAIPGLHSHTYSVMRTEQAMAAYEAYRRFVAKPGPIVVGAAQHAAILGPVYETAFLIDADLRRRHIRKRVPLTIVSPEPYPGHLGLDGQGEARGLLETALAKCDIQFIGNAATERVEAGRLHLLEYDDSGKQGQAREVHFGYSVYWPPFRGIAALRHTDLIDDRGFVITDEYLRSSRYHNVFALGVCVARAPFVRTVVPIGAPESVYSIQHEVEAVTTNIAATIQGEALTSAAPYRAHWIADVGETGARYLSAPQVPLENINWLHQGTWVHVAKGEFERYFIDKIKRGPAPSSDRAPSRLAGTVSRLASERVEGERAVPPTGRTVQRLDVPVETELAYALKAMAKVLHREPEELASALLKAAIQDAESYVDPQLRDEIQRGKREVIVANLSGEQAGVHFQGGAP